MAHCLDEAKANHERQVIIFGTFRQHYAAIVGQRRQHQQGYINFCLDKTSKYDVQQQYLAIVVP